MANPITAIASRSCAKNSLLKQTEDDLSAGSSTTEVSTTSDIPIASTNGSDIYGSRTDTTITSPGSEGTTKTKKRLSYREAYDQDIDGVRTTGMYKDYNAYVADREGQRKKDPEGFEAGMVAATGVSGGPGEVTITTPGEDPNKEKQDPEVTPDYEDAQGMSTFDIRKDFRRQKIAERLSGKSEKQARRYANRAERLTKRGKTEKAGIFDRKSKLASSRAENIRDRLKQFKVQQDQGGHGTSSHKTIKTRENLDAAKERITDNPKNFAGNDPTDFQRAGENIAKIAKDVKEKGLGAAKDVGDLVGNFLGAAPKKTVLKKNYFNK
jgi:hypothetical protein